jgi:conjugative relaxase-like TrwC/TraI family protein
MLSIAKLRVGQEAYQLSGVAQSLDAYYTGAGEASGLWVGGGAARLGLDGEVEPDDLRAVLAGLAPGRGGLTPNGQRPRPHPRRVPGFDLTFKAPKSASVLYAVSDDPRVQGAVIEAGEAAMRAALGWLEREAIRARRGSHNQAWLAAHTGEPGVGPRQLATSGVVAASFRHRTSRAGDPLLHWHVLVANLAQGTDGHWSAFTHPDLYRHVRAAGEAFQAVFRDELTGSLGVEWRPGRHVGEIAGIPQALLDTFSKRSTEIDAWLTATGMPDTPEGRQAAVLATRRHKPEVEHGRFDEAWKAEAEAAGWGPDAAERLVGWSMQRAGTTFDGAWRLDAVGFDEHGRAERYERIVDPEEWIAGLLRELTANASTFTEAELIRAVASRQGPGATMETIERIASRAIASRQAISVSSPDADPARWSSRELVDVESRFLAALTNNRPVDPLPGYVVDRAISSRRSLGVDQESAVRVLCAGTSAVSVMVGPAGTGKTYTLDMVRDASELAGFRVLGAAPSARAAIELAAGAHIRSRTLHSLLGDWVRGHGSPEARSLLVIDEAGMADIRTLEAVVTRQVSAGGRVLLVGDHRQLPEVGAGGGFAAATQHADCVAKLTVNRRQRQPWEQDALANLRDGSVHLAVEAYLTHARVVVTDTPEAMITAAVDKWFEARALELDPVLLAGTNSLVDRLNQAVIDRLADIGELEPTNGAFGRTAFRSGERVVLRRNSTERTVGGHAVDLANGQAGHVVDIAPDRLVIRLDALDDDIVLTDRYLRRGGHVTHAYALTTNRAQGGTWDLGIAVGAEGLYREGVYVELSRGAVENWIVLTDPEAAQLHEEALREIERHDTGLIPPDQEAGDTRDDLIERISRSHAKQLAHTLDPNLDVIDHLARSLALGDLEARRARAVTVERIVTDTHGYDAAELADRIDRIEQIARRVSVGCPVSPADRHNVGTVIALDDTAGQVTVHFVSGDGSEATRSFDWSELRIIDPQHTRPRPLSPQAETRLAAIAGELADRIDQWQATLRTFGVAPGDANRYERAIHRCVERETDALAAEQPVWLTIQLGHRPADVAGARAWDDAVGDIARWRSRHQIPDHTPGIGERPVDADHATHWDQLQCRLGLTRTWLAATDRIHPADTVVPSQHELLVRHTELDEIFTYAPADWRDTIDQLRRGQLSLDDTTELLQAALDGQDARRAWIIRNWPHVVEYQEINRTLTTATWGPDPRLLTDLLATGVTDRLAAAIDGNARWLRAALCAIAEPDANGLDDHHVQWLEELADLRTRDGMSPLEPLGDDARLTMRRHELHDEHAAVEPVPSVNSDLDL